MYGYFVMECIYIMYKYVLIQHKSLHLKEASASPPAVWVRELQPGEWHRTSGPPARSAGAPGGQSCSAGSSGTCQRWHTQPTGRTRAQPHQCTAERDQSVPDMHSQQHVELPVVIYVDVGVCVCVGGAYLHYFRVIKPLAKHSLNKREELLKYHNNLQT